MDQHKIDWPSFVTCVAVITLVCLPIVLAPDTAIDYLQSTYDWISRELGILYLLASVAAIGFLTWLAASRFGAIKLGQEEDEPEFSQVSWVAMLFCAGVGAGLLYWCATEWAYYYDSPPFGAEPRSGEAAEWASTYGMFHWGFTAWAFYCLPAIAIGYPYYVKKMNILRFSVSCNWFLKGKEQGPLARVIDLFFMIALIGGADALTVQVTSG